MNKLLGLALAALCIAPLFENITHAQVLTPGATIIAIDRDPPSSASNYPAAENPVAGLDGMPATKYLNFGGNVPKNIGIIATPTGGATTVRSLRFTTANDAVERDPLTWTLFGTNAAIVSADNSNGQGEAWTQIATGAANLPDTRTTVGPVHTFANSTAYSSYRVLVNEVKNFVAANSMQVADISLFTSTDGTGTSVLGATSLARAFQLPVPRAKSPAAEGPVNLLDGNTATKFLNFGEENAGVIVTLAGPATTIKGLRITTANDQAPRDPMTYQIFGTNDPITSAPFGDGNAENWTLISSGSTNTPTERLTNAPIAHFLSNNTAYKSYRVVFPTVRDAVAANSIQFADLQFFIPEPGSLGLALVAGIALCGLRRRQ